MAQPLQLPEEKGVVLGRQSAAARPTISVVLATYNGERHLEALLMSLASQEVHPLELVVGDDGSSDDTLVRLRRFAATSPFPMRITVNGERLGYADNFLTAAARAQGDIIAFCDQDDVWDSRKLKLVAAAFQTSVDVKMVAHHSRVIDEFGLLIDRPFLNSSICGRFPPESLPLNHFPGFALSIRREVLSAASSSQRVSPERYSNSGDTSTTLSCARCGLGERADARCTGPAPNCVGRFGHDTWVWLLAACLGDTIVLSQELVFYRQHNNLFGDHYITRRERLRGILQTGAETYSVQAQYWSGVAGYLEQLSATWRSEGLATEAERAFERGRLFRTRAYALSERAKLYQTDRRTLALIRYLYLARGNVYQILSRDGLLARHGSLKDLLFVLLRRLPIRERRGLPQ